jgi:hypothetical protein
MLESTQFCVMQCLFVLDIPRSVRKQDKYRIKYFRLHFLANDTVLRRKLTSVLVSTRKSTNALI